MEQKKKTIELFQKQLDFISLQCREGLFDGGIGSGKTKVGALWLATMANNYPKTRWMMVARDSNQLRNATDYEFRTVITEWLGWVEDVHYTRKISPQLEYTLRNGSTIIGAGAHNYDSVFRGPSISGLLGDEVDFWKEEAYLAAKGRVRVYPEFIRFVSSPKGYNFVWSDFYQNKSDNRVVINATAYDNPTLSSAYIESLKASYSPRLFEQEVMGKRLRINVGSVYSEFDRDKHLGECKSMLEDSDQLYFFTDYNIANYCGIYMFFKNGIVYAWGEEHLQYKGTREMAERIAMKFPNRQVIVIGDSAGNNKKGTDVVKTNYQLFEEVLGRGSTQKFTNPPVQSRIISANSNLYHRKVVIDISCTTLIKDLELLSWKENGVDIEKTIDLSHASDAYTYGLYFFIPVKRERKASRTYTL